MTKRAHPDLHLNILKQEQWNLTEQNISKKKV